MDSRAKQRLTGAVILVALFVLLVPELLTGPKSSNGDVSPEEEGLRRYTIDLNAPSPGNAPQAQPEVSLPPVAANPGSSDRVEPGEAAVPHPDPSVMPATDPEEVDRPAPAPAPASAAPAPQPSTQPAPAPAASPAPKGSFVVQLGSFGSRDNAERLMRDMNAKGFNTFIAPITTNGRELYRVRVGPTRDRASAEALAARLKRAGQSGSIVPIT